MFPNFKLAARDDARFMGSTSAASNDVLKNLSPLPLIHSHDGGKTTCPKSLENQRVIETNQQRLQRFTAENDQMRQKLQAELTQQKSRLSSPPHHIFEHNRGYIALMTKLKDVTQRSDDDLNQLRRNRAALVHKYQHIPHVQQQVAKIRTEINHLTRDLDDVRKQKHHALVDVQGNINKVNTELNALQQHHEKRVVDIDDKIKRLYQQKPVNTKISTTTTIQQHPQYGPQLSQLEKEKHQLKLQHEKDLSAYRLSGQTASNNFHNKYQDFLRRLDNANSNLRTKAHMVDTTRQRLTNLKQPMTLTAQQQQEIALWEKRSQEGADEVRNMQEKLGLMKKATSDDLAAFKTVNTTRLENYKQQLSTERDNFCKAIDEQMRETAYNDKNTFYQLQFGNVQKRPIYTKVEPRIERVLQIPIISQPQDVIHVAEQHNNYYETSGALKKPFQHRDLHLKQVTPLDTTIIHNTAVPRLEARVKEEVVLKDRVVTVGRDITEDKTIVEKKVIPGSVVTQTVPLSSIDQIRTKTTHSELQRKQQPSQ